MYVKGNIKAYIKGNLNLRVDSAKKSMCDSMISDTAHLVPYKTGNLSEDVDIIKNNNGIRYSAEYAPFVVGMPSSTNFNRSVHADATSHWNTKSADENAEKWYNEFKKEIT